MHPSNKYERMSLGRKKARKRFSKRYVSKSLSNNEIDETYEENVRRYRDTTKICSGPCCGNPRTHFGEVTKQEQEFEESLED